MGVGYPEMIVLGIVAVLLFGNKLPSVARSLGKSLTEFKKGMTDLQGEFHSAMNETPTTPKITRKPRDIDEQDNSAPKFEPPGGEPSPG